MEVSMAGKFALVTGFEPYGGRGVNPSAEVVTRVDGLELEGARAAQGRYSGASVDLGRHIPLQRHALYVSPHRTGCGRSPLRIRPPAVSARAGRGAARRDAQQAERRAASAGGPRLDEPRHDG